MTAASAAPRAVDRDTVVQVAAALADREGFAAVSLSAVAREVDRHVTSLYAHVESLADLRRAVTAFALEELADRVWRAVLGKVKGDALLAIAEEYRDYAIAHPGRTAAMLVDREAHDDELTGLGARLAEPVRATFRSFGLDDRQVVVAHSVFSATVEGFAGRGNDDFHQAVALFVAGLESGRWPT